jgi:2-iminobutanoate/2-iminopropanoate deaminase
MFKYITDAPGAPKAIGPYSQAVVAGNMVFLSGQVPLDPNTGKIESTDIVDQTKQVMRNIEAVLASEALTFKNVVKTTIFLTDLAHFQKVNEVYEVALGSVKPARSTVQVAALPRGAQVEIEMLALKS